MYSDVVHPPRCFKFCLAMFIYAVSSKLKSSYSVAWFGRITKLHLQPAQVLCIIGSPSYRIMNTDRDRIDVLHKTNYHRIGTLGFFPTIILLLLIGDFF
jgi:hypothetical protein